MKLSFTTFACPEWPLEAILAAAGRFNYHGLELRTDVGHNHGVEAWTNEDERKRFRDQFTKANKEIACIATSVEFLAEDIMETARQRIKLAADVGAKGARFFIGPLPEPYKSLDELAYRLSPILLELADYADVLVTDIWLETHDSIARGVDAARLVRELNHPRVAVCYNNLHPVRCGEPLEVTMAQLNGMIRHVHFHDGLNKRNQVVITPFGEGQMPMRETLQALIDQGYDGYLSGEWFYDQYGNNINDALEQYAGEVRELAGKLGLRIRLE
ncbi:MAG: sugar phosphate isomerase/epimerase [Phycisphaeraceae bacterium]